MPSASPLPAPGNSTSRLHQVLTTGCGAWDAKTQTAVETPCGVALTYAEGNEAPILVLATHKSIDAFAKGLNIKWTPKPSGWKNAWNVLPPYPLSYSRFYAVSGVDVDNDDAELIQSLGMYAFPSDESAKYKAWQTEVCKQCGCTSVVLFQSHP